jgi:hypothetical protein
MLVMRRELREVLGGYPPLVTQEPEDLDRVVSRRVHNPTSATEQDAPAYRAADPDADTPSGGDGGASERAAREMESDDESEPMRSE